MMTTNTIPIIMPAIAPAERFSTAAAKDEAGALVGVAVVGLKLIVGLNVVGYSVGEDVVGNSVGYAVGKFVDEVGTADGAKETVGLMETLGAFVGLSE